MRKVVSLLLVLSLLLTLGQFSVASAAEDVTVSLLTSRHTYGTNDIEDVWFFKYLEKYMSETYGYNLHLELEQTLESGERISLALATDDVPDLVWGIGLSGTNAVVYGAGEGIIRDWLPLITEESMPHLYALLENDPAILAASTCSDGKVYGLPMITDRDYWNYNGGIAEALRVYVNQKWLDACNLEQPTTIDEFINMLRAFKDVETPTGEPAIPVVSSADFLEMLIWGALGFSGNNWIGANGLGFAIQNDTKEVVLPCYTEQYREFVRIMNLLYTEGLISEDHFTMDGTTATGLMAAGRCGVMGWWTLGAIGDQFPDWVAIHPLTSDYCDKMIFADHANFNVYATWGGVQSKHPEVLAQIMDYMYSDEGASLYSNGPMAGEEFDRLNLGMLEEGWHLDENDVITVSAVEEGLFPAFDNYASRYILSIYTPAMLYANNKYTWAKAGVELPYTEHILTDALTGKPFATYEVQPWTDDTNNGHWFITSVNAWQNNVSIVCLPGVFLTEEESARANDLQTAIGTYVATETAKFIVGERSLDDLDAYFEALKGLNIEEYLEIYRTAYQPYMDSVFGE